MNDIEELRNWVKLKGNYRQIAEASGYPYDSLCKFACGQVAEPKYSKLQLLINYRQAQSEIPA